MTVGNVLSQMGIGSKIDRYHTEYAAPVHEYYSYDQGHSDGHAVSKHGYGGGHKSNAAMSALTLLAFLFFLHILQQCLRDHMNSMESQQFMIMTAGREGEENLAKITRVKVDKSGVDKVVETLSKAKEKNTPEFKGNPFDASKRKKLTKISTETHLPNSEDQRYKPVYKMYANRSMYPSFVSAMDDFK